MGTAPLGETFDIIEEDEARALLAAAWDGGVRYFDTSPWYGKGQAEHRLGRALYRRPREDYVISSKIGRVLRRPSKPGPFQRDSDWIGGLEFAHDMDYSYDGVMRSFEDSLQRLGHQPHRRAADPRSRHLAFQERGEGRALLEPARDQRLAGAGSITRSGVIKGIGAGFNTMGTIPKYLDFFDMDFFLIAMRYTLLEQDVLDAEFPRCDERGVGIVIGGTYNSGILATGAVPGARYNYSPAGPEILARVAKMEAVCQRHGVPLAAAALQFPLGQQSSPRSFPARSQREVEQNIAAFRHPIPADLWAELKHEKLIRADAPVPKA